MKDKVHNNFNEVSDERMLIELLCVSAVLVGLTVAGVVLSFSTVFDPVMVAVFVTVWVLAMLIMVGLWFAYASKVAQARAEKLERIF